MTLKTPIGVSSSFPNDSMFPNSIEMLQMSIKVLNTIKVMLQQLPPTSEGLSALKKILPLQEFLPELRNLWQVPSSIGPSPNPRILSLVGSISTRCTLFWLVNILCKKLAIQYLTWIFRPSNLILTDWFYLSILRCWHSAFQDLFCSQQGTGSQW